ncbi:hypothetical protein EZV73_06325 [Acidaminobacter sp. JC074]|uniref:EFR1 family ferrodoxin n=1 Tax=Acidaminobacter sp. JC074 TaxID=2530199 RepID=UPI001F0EF665|nr:EFR1 family ferrodoxin [Acidaminobacter sp. JC074]MCH4887177.1 hypothetical protein [Acidaminobacter sp. JC074]
MYGIYYFSGTGNTKALADMLNGHLDSRVYNIEKDFDLEEELIFLYPVHGFGVPKIVLDFARSLPESSKKVHIIRNGADHIRLNYYASFKLIEILEQKGYKVLYDRLVVMPANFLVDYPDPLKAMLYHAAKKKISHAAKEIKEGMIRRFDSNTLLVSLFNKIHDMQSGPGSESYYKYFKVADYCINCKTCVNNCPMNNIDDQINFGQNCIMCLRCVYNCPVHAIYSKGMLKKGYSLKTIKYDQNYKPRGFYKHFIKYVNNIEK